MKKYFVIITTAALVAGCAENSSINKSDLQGEAIAFTSYSQPTTKATENNESTYSWELLDHHDDFYVYGYKTVNTNITKVFDKQKVEWDIPDLTTDDWNYTPARYWDKAASSYYFYAAAPVAAAWTLNANTESVSDDYFTYEGYSLSDHDATASGNGYVESFKSQKSSAVDLMIADKCPWADYTRKVNLNFIHILSRFNVLIKRGDKLDQNDVVTLKDFKVFNFYAGGNFSEATAANTAGSIARWNNRTGSVDYTSTNEADIVVGDGTTPQYILQSLVVPQEISYKVIAANGTTTCDVPEAYFMVEYQIHNENWTGDKTETFKAYYNLAAAFGATTDNTETNDKDESKIAFNEGWQNNLILKINPDKIEFDADVSQWSTKLYDLTPAGDIH